jgi:hypothetical protein
MTQKKWSTIKGALKDVSRAGLLGLVTDLYKLNAENKRFLHTRFDENLDPLKEYKEIIEKNIAPNDYDFWNRTISSSKARRAISDYKKALGKPEGVLELMVYYCECGTDFTIEMGDIDEAFYNSLGSMYNSVFEFLNKEPELKGSFLPRLQNIITKAKKRGIGWGFSDHISFLLENYLESEKTNVGA